MTQLQRRRLNLSALERHVLLVLASRDARWYTSAMLAVRLPQYEHAVIISALNNLRRRGLSTEKIRGLGSDVLWSITTLGEGALAEGVQLRLT
jgi:hypothetical protein